MPVPTKRVPTADVSDCMLGAAFVRDVTIPDGTELAAGEQFAKTWEIRNTGTCPWGAGYRVLPVGDTLLEGDDYADLPIAAPGEQVAVTVDLVAPNEAGRYRSEWQVCVNDDQCFGTRFYVEIVSLGLPTATPRPSPTQKPSPTVDTSSMLTVRGINDRKRTLTELQWDTYRKALVGQKIQFAGEVIEVYKDGRVQIDDGPAFAVCVLYGIPHSVSITLTKDSYVKGYGVVREVGTFIGLYVYINIEHVE